MRRGPRTALWIAIAAFLIYAITGGGRIVGSDEVTMLELSRAMLHGHLDVPEGATLQGRDGRFYTKNSPGEAVLALPLVAVAETATRAAGLPPEKQVLALRFFVSFFNAAVAAVLLAVFYAVARDLGVHVGAALAATGMLGLTTPLWVYAKSFMAEPLQSLGLLLALWGSLLAVVSPRRTWIAASGFLLATLVKPSMGPLALACWFPLWWRAGTRGRIATGLVVAISLVLYGLYNWFCFRNPFQTGYGHQAGLSAYTTPLWVGVYGLLFSSGKGVLWFAPLLWLVPAGWRLMWRVRERSRDAAIASIGCVILALLIYGTFEHWAGDGSYGPRYLVALLPLAFLAVAFALDRAGPLRRTLATALAAAGLIVQIGGVSIHFGAQMREAGDYPYSRPLNDPRFMSESHFDPHFSPIVGHWRMLLRNAAEHLRGQAPHLDVGGMPDARVGVSESDQERLLHGLDFWWLYMTYAGLPALPIGLAVGVLLALLAWSIVRLRAAALEEARAG